MNDFLGYHLADLCDLGQQGKLLHRECWHRKAADQTWGQSTRMLVTGGLLLTFDPVEPPLVTIPFIYLILLLPFMYMLHLLYSWGGGLMDISAAAQA